MIANKENNIAKMQVPDDRLNNKAPSQYTTK
jgi:hypothetical protein